MGHDRHLNMTDRKPNYNEISPEKRAMYKKLYLAGMSVEAIGRSFGKGIGRRTVYSHLQPLTPEEIAMHNKNSYIRRRSERKAKKEKEAEDGAR